jgi:hypothetical protein
MDPLGIAVTAFDEEHRPGFLVNPGLVCGLINGNSTSPEQGETPAAQPRSNAGQLLYVPVSRGVWLPQLIRRAWTNGKLEVSEDTLDKVSARYIGEHRPIPTARYLLDLASMTSTSRFQPITS